MNHNQEEIGGILPTENTLSLPEIISRTFKKLERFAEQLSPIAGSRLRLDQAAEQVPDDETLETRSAWREYRVNGSIRITLELDFGEPIEHIERGES